MRLRRRLSAAVSLACAAALAAVGLGGTTGGSAPAAGAPDPQVDYGDSQFLEPLRDAGWVCGDGFLSSSLPDGKALWIYQDSLVADGRFVRNAVAVSHFSATGGLVYDFDSGSGAQGFVAAAGPPDQSWNWPTTALPSVQDDYVHLTSNHMVRDAAAQSGFQYAPESTHIVSYRYDDGVLEQVGDSAAPQIGDWAGRPITWGAAAGYDDDWVYLYGVGRDRDPRTWGHAVYVARIGRARLFSAEVSGFQVRSESGWLSPDGVRVDDLTQVGASFSTVFQVNHRPDGAVVAAVKTYEFMGNSIDLYRATAPGKPFGLVRRLVTLPPNPGALTYWVKAHPELPAPPDTVWASSNNTHVEGEMACPDRDPHMRPIFYLLPAFVAPRPVGATALGVVAPKGVGNVAVSVQRRRAALSWGRVAGATGYRVRVRGSRSHASWQYGKRVTARIGGLRPGTRYTAQVGAVNAAGRGPIVKQRFRTRR